MFSNCRNLHSVHSFADARRLFNNQPRPTTKRRGSSVWGEDERPLNTNQQWHYRIERGFGEAYYDICLYQTNMARYHKPAEDGSYVVEYTSHHSPTSSSFMWSVLGTGSKALHWKRTTDNKQVCVPLSDKYLGTRLTYTKDGLLDVSRSMHQPIYTEVLSDEGKALNKRIRTQLAILLDLFALRIEDIHRDWECTTSKWDHSGKPFKGLRHGGQLLDDVRRNYMPDAPDSLDETAIISLQALYDACVERAAATRDYRKDESPIVAANVRSLFLKKVSEAVTPGYGHFEKKEQPMFPESLPTKFSF